MLEGSGGGHTHLSKIKMDYEKTHKYTNLPKLRRSGVQRTQIIVLGLIFFWAKFENLAGGATWIITNLATRWRHLHYHITHDSPIDIISLNWVDIFTSQSHIS